MIYRELVTEEIQFLCLTMKNAWSEQEAETINTYLGARGNDHVYNTAQKNQMLPLVANALIQTVPKELSSRWQTLLDDNHHRVEALVTSLEEITTELSSRGCLSAAVEAGGIMLGSSLNMSAFCSGDIDVLVQEKDWDVVRSVFEQSGFHSDDSQTTQITRAEYCKKAGSDTLRFEVSFVPFYRKWIPLDYCDRSANWLSRAVPSNKAAGIPVLHPTDALVFVAFHTSLHSFVRAPGLRLQIDVDRLVRDCEIDWEQFIQEVCATEIKTRAFVSLSMAKGLLDTPIPERVLVALAPNRAKWTGIFRLLQRNGVTASNSPKLGRLEAIILDILISERSLPGWAKQVFFPGKNWLHSHYGDGDNHSSLSLHAKRIKSLASRWNPK